MKTNVEKERFLAKKHFSFIFVIGTIVLVESNELYHLNYITTFDNGKLIERLGRKATDLTFFMKKL
jgi:hypothetical protein